MYLESWFGIFTTRLLLLLSFDKKQVACLSTCRTVGIHVRSFDSYLVCRECLNPPLLLLYPSPNRWHSHCEHSYCGCSIPSCFSHFANGFLPKASQCVGADKFSIATVFVCVFLCVCVFSPKG